MTTNKDIGWKYAIKVDGERSTECKFCHHRSNGGITRVKEHLEQTLKGVAPCDKVPVEVSKEIRDSLQTFKTLKNKRNELLWEIGAVPTGSRLSQSISDTDGFSQGGSNSHSKGTGTLDKFVLSEPRQTTINSAYKKELKKQIDRCVARFVYSARLSFNVVNDPHCLPLIEGIGEYGKGYKPPSMHELRTRLLKSEEVKDELYACMDQMLSPDDRLQVDIQLDFYDNAQGEFGSPIAKKSRMLRSPEDPALPNNTTWLVDDELFEGDPIVSMPSETFFDSLMDSDKRVENEDQNHSPIMKKKRVGESSTNIELLLRYEVVESPTMPI
ncbi:hAT transposon superfamily [Striga hermonthica]|uniref:HAT transposon superfamily n=1 Tax=Striga hermonthica TaxID=68872 RepID=A0A9N7MS90_STRHE|nr:hAT transposon superfamily [Striga hermonthica]